MITRKQILFGGLSAIATLALAGSLQTTLAQDAGPATAPPTGHWHGGHMREGGPGGGLLSVLRQLNLSDAQKQQLHTLMSAARAQNGSGAALAELPALGNPGDPGHAAAVQAAEDRAVQRIRQWNELEQQIYGLLTPAQQAQLPQLLQAQQQRISQRRAAHARPAAAATTPGHPPALRSRVARPQGKAAQ